MRIYKLQVGLIFQRKFDLLYLGKLHLWYPFIEFARAYPGAMNYRARGFSLSRKKSGSLWRFYSRSLRYARYYVNFIRGVTGILVYLRPIVVIKAQTNSLATLTTGRATEPGSCHSLQGFKYYSETSRSFRGYSTQCQVRWLVDCQGAGEGRKRQNELFTQLLEQVGTIFWKKLSMDTRSEYWLSGFSYGSNIDVVNVRRNTFDSTRSYTYVFAARGSSPVTFSR